MVMEEIFNKLFKAGLTPNSFYVLYSYKTKTTCNNSINTSLEVSRLESDLWISMGELTSKSIVLIQEIDSYFKLSKKKTSTQVMGTDFLTKIDEYLEIFPKFKLPSGKYARSDKKNLENNL